MCLGDNCLDHYLPPLDREFVGGNALNVAIGLRDHGHDVAYAGAVGSDDAGDTVREAARTRGIDTSHVHVGPGATGVTTIRLTADGDRVFESEVLGESGRYRPDPATLADLDGSLALAGGIHHQPPVPVSVVDTLGAGDAYIAACISTLVEGGTLETALRLGAEAAARTCTHYGAWLELEELEASA